MKAEKFDYLLQRIEEYVNHFEVSNTNDSKATVGWHLDHSLKVIIGVMITLKKSNPELYKNNFTILGRIFFALGFFPRGKAKAPKYVLPPKDIKKEDLITQLNSAKQLAKDLPSLEENSFFKHPIFGNTNKKRVTNFLYLHTNHHLKIISDILSK